jgi:hypothetical protein
MFDVPLTFKDELHVRLFNAVDPETLKDDVHVVVLLIMVIPDIYNDVFIEIPALFNRMDSQFP